MKKEQIQDFTRKITQSNRSGLTVVIYEIFFAYTADAREAFADGRWQDCKEAIRMAERTVQELMDTLDFSYELAGQLHAVYTFCRDSLAKSMYKKDMEDLQNAERLMRKLYESFEKVAKQDDSAPLMSNTQHVYAGYTYGKEDLVENCQELDNSRGFFV